MVDDGTIHIIDEAKIREAEALEKVKLAETEASQRKVSYVIALIAAGMLLLFSLLCGLFSQIL